MRTVKPTKPWLRRISRLLLLCLAFQSVAVAAHACPIAVAVAATRACHGMAAADCTRTAMPDSALCAQHCTPDHATAAASADLQVPLAFLPALPPTLPASAQPPPVAAAFAVPHASPPQPIRTRYCSLLI